MPNPPRSLMIFAAIAALAAVALLVLKAHQNGGKIRSEAFNPEPYRQIVSLNQWGHAGGSLWNQKSLRIYSNGEMLFQSGGKWEQENIFRRRLSLAERDDLVLHLDRLWMVNQKFWHYFEDSPIHGHAELVFESHGDTRSVRLASKRIEEIKILEGDHVLPQPNPSESEKNRLTYERKTHRRAADRLIDLILFTESIKRNAEAKGVPHTFDFRLLPKTNVVPGLNTITPELFEKIPFEKAVENHTDHRSGDITMTTTNISFKKVSGQDYYHEFQQIFSLSNAGTNQIRWLNSDWMIWPAEFFFELDDVKNPALKRIHEEREKWIQKYWDTYRKN